MAVAPAPGTLGIGVGTVEEWGFHSIVWFSYEDAEEAQAFAEQNGYETKNGVPL